MESSEEEELSEAPGASTGPEMREKDSSENFRGSLIQPECERTESEARMESSEDKDSSDAPCSAFGPEKNKKDSSRYDKRIRPVKITVSNISSESLSLQWDTPADEVESFTVTCSTEGETDQQVTTDTISVTLSNLKPAVCYSLHVSAQLRDGRQSRPATTTAETTREGLNQTECETTEGEARLKRSEKKELADAPEDSPTSEMRGEDSSENDNVSSPDQKSPEDSQELNSDPNSCVHPPESGTQSKAASMSESAAREGLNQTECETTEGEARLKRSEKKELADAPEASLVSEKRGEDSSENDNQKSPEDSQGLNSDPNSCVHPPESGTQSKAASMSESAVTDSLKQTECERTESEARIESSKEKELADAPEASLVSEKRGEDSSENDSVSSPDQKSPEDSQGLNSDPNSCVDPPESGTKSKAASMSESAETHLESFLEDLGLEQFYTQKLSLSKILQIDKKTTDDQPAKCKSDLPWYFLKKLMMVNVTARNVKYTSDSKSGVSGKTGLNLKNLVSRLKSANMLNPLDIITALFLCSDGFVQQELALKMSMCQFSVPLLLPDCDKNQSTLMVRALRDIVKKYRPKSLSESKGFIEDRIVVSELPMISFVRLGECSLSKSEILNKLLSSSQQYHDTFVHHNMDCGDSPRRISNGLTEITWYLPCGNENIDIFSHPVALANLRGDMASFQTQFSFLCQTSAAVFVFFDNLDPECELLTNLNSKSEIFLVGNHQSRNFSLDALEQVATEMSLTDENIILKTTDINEADFVKRLREAVTHVVEKTKKKMRIEQMAEVALKLGILVDEDSPEYQSGKKKADAITAEIRDILKYKEDQLPLQGQIWKDLTSLEKEEVRLRKVGSENIEKYKSDLQLKKKKLRQKQNTSGISKAMTSFISAISSNTLERGFFLKWMRINLDDMSRVKLSELREQYKDKCKNSENNEEIKEIDQQISNSSLGTEHFFREMGQIYEASLALEKPHPSHQQLNHLPKLGAQLLLDGFPLELVDGDASNIPLSWVSDVLSQLSDLVGSKNRILVVTVLGVQSTGKSTLLNTMFGVQFAVSSGRCTRGAFMLLIRIDEELQKELKCDFMMIIDTEGLKSPELTQLDNSYEHDNELATLVVGLSDITIINIAMENSTEMKDILQIVVHAFLRMKEVGKKPQCYFVHQNVSDVSAHDKNLRDRKLLFQQLNEMTQAAAKMEKKEQNKSFTDVMAYDPDTGNCYIPGLWTGNPPMAPVNTGYSEAVYELKKNIIQLLRNRDSPVNKVLEFKEWMTSLWNAVKHENFLFSFRNSLVADAYMRLCTEFNKWEWEFKKEMYNWVTNAETKISNIGTLAAQSKISDLTQFHSQLKTEAVTVMSVWETKLLDNVTQYFKQTDGHVYLVVGHKEEFENSARSLRNQTERSVLDQLQAAVDIKQGMAEIDRIKENHTKEIEKAASELIEKCRKRNVQMNDEELDEEFNKMWNETVSKLTFKQQHVTNVFENVSCHLRVNLAHRGSYAHEILNKTRLEDCGKKNFKYKAAQFFNKMTDTILNVIPVQTHTKAAQENADCIIKTCEKLVNNKQSQKSNYHNNYIEEVLKTIDQHLEQNQDLKEDTHFEVSLKLHICGFTARKFQKMHEDFLEENDPYRCLNKYKAKFCSDFKDVFHKRDQCQKKAEEFVNKCLKPAVEDFINRYLGLSIVDEMLKKQEFSTRVSFQYYILLDLLSRQAFDDYLSFTSSYQSFVKKWILKKIKEHFSSSSKTSEFEKQPSSPSSSKISELENQHLETNVSRINEAIEKAKTQNRGNVQTFVEDICKDLGDKLTISQEALGAFMILNNADQDKFAHYLTISVKELKKTLTERFHKTSFEDKLQYLHIQPGGELFKRVIGCGKQCPFCAVPCEAGGEAHAQHRASLHRPDGLRRYRWRKTDKLSTDICSSSVESENRFRCSQTKNEWHPYKNYRDIFPDWDIFSDGSLEASDYWKYIMTKYNDDFAKEYNAEPADIPETWREITSQQAEESLKKSFNVNVK
ncbi:interferon-induced very large GTPase 1-like isoform X2 [Salarias fasciatus]|uniref:interferon-induced very large GTPase 1-like isoform X2 n=1 Tax=Salarias fasciatus TaxID=181472 RepID=UPI0011768C36|nr:interferon-induced very large GTPase 1-like isoform X2 [Salarias fasciatus]